MEKDFLSWHLCKSEIENSGEESLIFHEKEIWWCSLGLNVGSEQDEK